MKKLVFYLVLLTAAVTFIYPFLWMASISLRPSSEIGSLGLFSSNFTLANYRVLFSDQEAHFGRALLNSAIVATLITMSVLFFSSLLGYALARLQFYGRDFIFHLILFSMMIPFQLTMIPLYTLIVKLGWPDTYQALIVPYMISAMGVLIFRQTYLALPKELIEAAQIEGCNHFTILTKIFWPLSRPAMVTVGIVTFMGAWNEVLWPILVVRKWEMMTMPQMLTLFTLGGKSQGQFAVELAAAMLLVMPILLAYLFFQRYFIEGIAGSGIKG